MSIFNPISPLFIDEYLIRTLSTAQYLDRYRPEVFSYAQELMQKQIPLSPTGMHKSAYQKEIWMEDIPNCKRILKKVKWMDEEGELYPPVLRILQSYPYLSEQYQSHVEFISIGNLKISAFYFNRMYTRLSSLQQNKPRLFEKLQEAIQKDLRLKKTSKLAFFLDETQKVSRTVRAVLENCPEFYKNQRRNT